MRVLILSILAAASVSACGTVVQPAESWAGGVRGFGQQVETPPEALCSAISSWDNEDRHTVYRISNYEAQLERCNVAPFSIAVRGDGLARPVYGDEGLGRYAEGRSEDTNVVAHLQEAELQADEVLNLLRTRIRDGAFGMAPAIECREGDDGVNRCRETGPVKVLIFAHGGMVSHQSAVLSAEALSQFMMADGYFPTFLIWNSHFFDAYTNYLCCVSQRAEPERYAQNFTIAARIFGDLGSGLARLPQNALTQGSRFRRSVTSQDDPLYFLPTGPADSAECDGAATAATAATAPREQMGLIDFLFVPSLVDREDRDDWRRRAELAQLCHRRNDSLDLDAFEAGGQALLASHSARLTPRHSETVVFPPGDNREDLNALYDTTLQRGSRYVVLGLPRAVATLGVSGGQSAWNNMVRRARMAIYNGSEFAGTPLDRSKGRASEPSVEGLGGHGVFFERFRQAYESAPKDRSDSDGFRAGLAVEPLTHRQIEITFVGHSMGAFIGNAVLERYGQDLPISRVIYMGAAAPIREFNLAARQAVAGRPADEPISFYNLMLHPLAESRELAPGNIFAGTLPQGSLLEWIDEYFEGPRVASERTVGKWSNVWRAWPDFAPEVRERTLFRVFPAQEGPVDSLRCLNSDDRCHPRSHGDFTNYSFWRDGFLGGVRPAREPADQHQGSAGRP